MSDTKELGPNAQKLLIRFISREAIPPGGSIADGAKFLMDEVHRKAVYARARQNMETAFTAVRAAPDNPHGDDEEAIAAAILAMLEERP